MKKYFLIIGAALFIATLNSCVNNEAVDMPSGPYFPQVKSIVENNCWSCHNSSGTWTGRPVAFDTDTIISQQYMQIKAAVADPVTITNKRMPQGGMLSEHDLDVIVKWFDKGGKITD